MIAMDGTSEANAQTPIPNTTIYTKIIWKLYGSDIYVEEYPPKIMISMSKKLNNK